MPPYTFVRSTVVFKAFEHVKDATEEVIESIHEGQVLTGDITDINSFNIEVAYMGTKYQFHIECTSPDVYQFTLGGNVVDVGVTQSAEGSLLLASFGKETHRIVGMGKPLGLKLSLDGNTTLM